MFYSDNEEELDGVVSDGGVSLDGGEDEVGGGFGEDAPEDKDFE